MPCYDNANKEDYHILVKSAAFQHGFHLNYKFRVEERKKLSNQTLQN